MTDATDDVERPDLSERANALGAYLGKAPGEFEPFGAGYELLKEWLRAEILCNDLDRLGHDGIDLVVSLLGEDFPLATNVRELWGAASGLKWLFGEDNEPSIEIHLGDWAITWGVVSESEFVKRTVLIDGTRPLPDGMRHWFERAGIYQSKRYGLHRRWRTYRHIHGTSRKARFAAGTMEGSREFRVLPHLDRMDICDGNFDRWANSTAASVPMPRTQAEFEAALVELVERSAARLCRVDTQEAA
jgi:hypothetical protein